MVQTDMHEMGIAASVWGYVAHEMESRPGNRLVKVGLRIGEFAGLDTESLRFCFEVVGKQFAPSPVALDIIWCRARDGQGGDELDIAWLELDDDNPEQELAP